jgi:hypothetical protein
VNEGAKLLEARIALRASDIDVACVLAYGWPVYTGGPMFGRIRWACRQSSPRSRDSRRGTARGSNPRRRGQEIHPSMMRRRQLSFVAGLSLYYTADWARGQTRGRPF